MNHVDNYGKFYKLLKLLPGGRQGDLGAAVYQRENRAPAADDPGGV